MRLFAVLKGIACAGLHVALRRNMLHCVATCGDVVQRATRMAFRRARANLRISPIAPVAPAPSVRYLRILATSSEEAKMELIVKSIEIAVTELDSTGRATAGTTCVGAMKAAAEQPPLPRLHQDWAHPCCHVCSGLVHTWESAECCAAGHTDRAGAPLRLITNHANKGTDDATRVLMLRIGVLMMQQGY